MAAFGCLSAGTHLHRKLIKMDEAPSTLTLSLPPSISILALYFGSSRSLSPSPRRLFPSLFPRTRLSLHVFHFLPPSPFLSPSHPYLPCRYLVSLVPFKARQMERQALSPLSGPNDLFLTMGPNGPQIINDEGSMER